LKLNLNLFKEKILTILTITKGYCFQLFKNVSV